MHKYRKSYVLVFLGSLVLTVLTLILLQLQPAGYAALGRCSENDIKVQKPSCVSALQDSLNVHFVACSADKSLLSIGDKVDDATVSVASQYAQQKGIEVPENLASQDLINALKDETVNCKTAPAVAVIDSATVTRYESNSSNQIPESVVTKPEEATKTSLVENSKATESTAVDTKTSTGTGDSKTVASKWIELGTVYPEQAPQRATVKLYACRQGGSIRTKYTVQSTSYSSATQFRLALTDDSYTVLYKYSASTVKPGGSYESTDIYSPAARFHPGIYVGSGDSASWSYLQKSFSSGDITACA